MKKFIKQVVILLYSLIGVNIIFSSLEIHQESVLSKISSFVSF